MNKMNRKFQINIKIQRNKNQKIKNQRINKTFMI